MWLTLFLCILIATLLLIVPGYPFLRLLGLPRTWALCSAPALTASLVSVLSVSLSLAHVPNNALTIALAPCALFLALFIALRHRIKEIELPTLSWRAILLFAIVGCAAGSFVFLRILPSPEAFAQAWDNVHHINSIRAFAQSYSFDSLHQSAYATVADRALNPMPDEGYYPACWHAICALVMQLTHAPGGLIENAVDFSLGAIVFPLSMLALFTRVFETSKRIVAIGAFSVVAFPLFPWEMFSYGPLYANLASFACMPTLMWLLVGIIAKGAHLHDRMRLLVAFLIGCIGVIFLQPNSVFTIGVLIAPLFVQRIVQIRPEECSNPLLSKLFKIPFITPTTLAILFACLCMYLWYFAYNLPQLAGVVHSGVWHWKFASSETAFLNILTLAYVGNFYTSNPQLLSAILVLVGIVRAFKQRSYLWLVFAYAIAASTVYASMCMEESIKELLSGFWYCDPFRCGAMASLAAMPLLALGADWALSGGFKAIAKLRHTDERALGSSSRRVIEFLACAFFVVVTFAPNLNARAIVDDSSEFIPNEEYPSASYVLARWYTFHHAPYTADEIAFVARVVDTIGEDALVINQPYDGSVYAYGENGLRTYYRKFRGYGYFEETTESLLIRDHLNSIASMPTVREACRTVGAQYVLILHRSDIGTSFLESQYYVPAWRGIDSITDNTPGFEVVLSENDMRLYRISVP